MAKQLRRSISGQLRSVSDQLLSRRAILFVTALLLALIGFWHPSTAFSKSTSPYEKWQSRTNLSNSLQALEEVVFVSSSANPGIQLETTIFKPEGLGPFPLVVMNHGKAFSAPARQARARYPVLSQEFVRRGYAVVIPMRQGFSRSGGSYAATGCDLITNAQEQAKDVDAVVRHFQKQSWIRPNQVLVIGQSHGGLVTMSLAEHAAPGVQLLVNFAGGLRSNGGRCKSQWQDQMVLAFQRFGERARIPSTWFYGQNDGFFDPVLVKRMHAAYLGSTKPTPPSARLIAFSSFGQDSHGMVEYSGGVRLWWPELERDLKRLGFPVLVIRK
jgi:dienelactone hydrolase